jgi:MOSC domain-containing protein YiiM
VLIQTREHLTDLATRFPALAENFTKPTAFGENLLISGELVASKLCIGDIIHIVRPDSANEIVGVLQISNPRLPCFKVDHKHRTWTPGEPMPALTVRGYCAQTGHAGFFCRVLRTGSIASGDRLVLAQRPLPQWTLSGISELMYGGINARQAELRKWRGTEEQLAELMGLKVQHSPDLPILRKTDILQLLGWFEWRQALHKFVEKREKLAAELQAEEDAEQRERSEAAERERAAQAAALRRVQVQALVAVFAVAVGVGLWLRQRSVVAH